MKATSGRRAVALALIAAGVLAGCQSAPQAAAPTAAPAAQPNPPAGKVAGDPARVIEDYLKARVEANTDAMINLSCADWEADARKESNSLRGVKSRLEGVSCAVDSASDATALVACKGNIVANYNGEDRPLPLDKRKFKLTADGGQWLMCGYE